MLLIPVAPPKVHQSTQRGSKFASTLKFAGISTEKIQDSLQLICDDYLAIYLLNGLTIRPISDAIYHVPIQPVLSPIYLIVVMSHKIKVKINLLKHCITGLFIVTIFVH